MLVGYLQVHRLRQIIGWLLGARATNPPDHMSAACQAQSRAATEQSYAGQGNTHTHVSSPAFSWFSIVDEENMAYFCSSKG